ncbi:MAG: hypothetical protein ACRD27_12640 [Terracidiphilus sp.]
MRSFLRFALLLAVAFAGAQVVLAQSTSSSSQTSTQTQAQAGQAPSLTQQEMTVQQRIRLRREQRRQQAIHDTYGHLYEVYVGMGYLRFTPGPHAQRTTLYGWDTEISRYYNVHLGITADVSGYDGIAYVGLSCNCGITRPKISQYDFMVGPTYRLMLTPKYSLAARVMGGYALGNFTGDTGPHGSICPTASYTNACLLYPDGGTYAISGDILGEYNVTPTVALRLSGTDHATGFGSTMQNSRGFSGGVVYRFGKR